MEYIRINESDEEQCQVIDVEGDSNCFYRVVQIALGYSNYMLFKDLVHDFARKLWEFT
jgi:hypothetical protein